MPNKSISVTSEDDIKLWEWAERESKRARFGSMSAFVLWLIEREREADTPIDRRANGLPPQQLRGRTVRITATDADGNPTGEVVTLNLPSGHFVCEHWEKEGETA